ncbi:MAG: hypothetical protein GC139_05285 [Sideroxydans sp.]|nr:hypothetical protein [Sideroxydans sp.]
MYYIIPAIVFVGILVVAAIIFEYWQNRRWGHSHSISLRESAMAGTVLSGSAVFGYIAAVTL